VTTYTVITTLDDAYTALHSAIGRPDTTSGRDRIQFFLRIAVILGWLSVEEAVKDEIRSWIRAGYTSEQPRTLTDKICLLCALRRHMLQSLEASADEHQVRLTREERDQIIGAALTKKAEIGDLLSAEKSAFDFTTFKQQRIIRSDVVHDNTQRVLTIDAAKSCLGYCSALIEIACDKPVIRDRTRSR